MHALAERPTSSLLARDGTGVWRAVPAAEVARRVRELTVGLIAHGAEPGARVGLLSESRPEALLADLAVQAYGGSVVPIAPESTPAELGSVLSATEARIVLVSGTLQLEKVFEVRPDLPRLDLVLRFDRPADESAVASADLDSVRAIGAARLLEKPELFQDALAGADHRGGVWRIRTGGEPGALLVLGADNPVTELPPSRRLARGWRRGRILLPASRRALRGPPRPGQRIHARLRGFVPRPRGGTTQRRGRRASDGGRLGNELVTALDLRGWLGRQSARWALRRGRRKVGEDLAAGVFPSPPPWTLRIADRLALHGIRQGLTGGRIRHLVSLGAPLERGTFEVLHAAGLPVLEGYDLDLVSGLLAIQPIRSPRPGTVGRPLPGLELRVDGHGRLQVRGPMVGDVLDPPSGKQRNPGDWVATKEPGRIDGEGWLIPGS